MNPILFFLKKKTRPLYVLAGRVADWARAFVSSNDEVGDRTTNDNDLTLYSGRYVSLDGTGDSVDFSDLSFSGVPAKITGRARTTTDTTVPFELNGVNLEGRMTQADFDSRYPTGSAIGDNLDKLGFDGENDNIQLPSDINFGTGDFTQEVSFIFNGGIGAILGGTGTSDIRWSFKIGSPTTITIREQINGTIYNLPMGFSMRVGQRYDFELNRTGNTLTLKLGGEVVDTENVLSSDEFGFNEIGSQTNGTNLFFTGAILSVNVNSGQFTWDGTIEDAETKGWEINGSPQTVEDSQIFNTLYTNNTWQDVEAPLPADLLANADKLWFDGDASIVIPNSSNITGGNFSISLKFILANIQVDNDILSQKDGSGTGRTWLKITDFGFLKTNLTGSVETTLAGDLKENTQYTVTLDIISGVASGTLSGGGVSTSLPPFSVLNEGADGDLHIGTNKLLSSSFLGVIYDAQFAGFSWDGTLANLPAGWTVSPSAQTVAQAFTNPSSYTIASDGTNNFSGDLSDIKILDGTNNVLHNAQLTEHYNETGNSLNSLPAFDTVNNNHGSYVGCAGFTGEGIDPEVIGTAFEENEDKLFFDGSQRISGTAFDLRNATVAFDLVYTSDQEGQFIQNEDAANSGQRLIATINSTVSANNDFVIETETISGSVPTGKFVANGLVDGTVYSAVCEFNASGDLTSVALDGSPLSDGAGASRADSDASNQADTFILARRFDGNFPYSGFFGFVDFNGTTWDGTLSNLPATWTVNGNPVTVGQKRETILQTAGQDWNRGGLGPEAINEDWESGQGPWKFLNATIDTVDPYEGSQSLKLTITGGGAARAILANSLVIGRNYRATGYIKLSDATKTGRVDFGSGNQNAISVGSTTWEAFSVEGVCTTSSDLRLFRGSTFGTYTVNFDNVVVTEVYDSSVLVPASLNTPSLDALGNPIVEPRNPLELNFFGDGEYAESLDSDSLDVTTEATWEFVAKMTGNTSQVILGKYLTVGDQRSWLIQFNGVDRLQFFTSLDGTVGNTSFQSFAAGSALVDEYAHYVITYNGGNASLYVNGVFQSSITGQSSLFNSNAPLVVGAEGARGVSITKNAESQIGSVKVYNRALLQEEVTQNYNAQRAQYGLPSL